MIRSTPFTTTITTTTAPGRDAILLAYGPLDMASTPTLRSAVLRCLAEGSTGIEVDMSSVSFIDCSGISAMFDIRGDVHRSGSTISVIRPSARVRRLIGLTHTDVLLTA